MSDQIKPNGISFIISDTDQALLATVFDIADPGTLGGMRVSIPSRSELQFDQVEGVYDIDASASERDRWIRCCECKTDHNHKHGFVLRFVDGSRATVGKDCAREKHSLDYKDFLEKFDERRDRATSLRQVMIAAELVHGLVRHIDEIGKHRGLLRAGGLRYEIEKRLPELYRKLVAAKGGIFIAPFRVRDSGAEKLRDAKLDEKLAQLARRKNMNRDGPGVDKLLLEELRSNRDPLASKDKIMGTEDKEFGRFAGYELFTKFEPAKNRLPSLSSRLAGAIQVLHGKESASFTVEQMVGVRRKFIKAIDDTFDACTDINNALGFASPTNIAHVVATLDRLPSLKGTLSVKDNHIIRQPPRAADIDCSLPSSAVSVQPFERAKWRIENLPVDVPITDERAIAAE